MQKLGTLAFHLYVDFWSAEITFVFLLRCIFLTLKDQNYKSEFGAHIKDALSSLGMHIAPSAHSDLEFLCHRNGGGLWFLEGGRGVVFPLFKNKWL